MRIRRLTRAAGLILAVMLVAVSCGDDDSGGGEPAAADAAATEESTSTTTTAAIPEGGESIEGLQLSAIVFGDDGHVTLTNTSDSTVTLDGLWLCNRPAYTELTGSLGAGESLDVEASRMGGLSADGGEAGLYISRSFDSASDMVDYVVWGSGGGRAGVADRAGLWPAGVTVTPTAELIELFGVPGDPESWS